ncbi:hypothetical protein L596_025590 [Steinernema carpocapsae]|uniref:Uncharacterized protein n=1 Tax=Steinernema carpocapsae TaxID=34508 RepID=A0A4U5M877_STECR|nr:hypothetical protein L596_025590 [Steinernema carpocapsae]
MIPLPLSHLLPLSPLLLQKRLYRPLARIDQYSAQRTKNATTQHLNVRNIGILCGLQVEHKDSKTRLLHASTDEFSENEDKLSLVQNTDQAGLTYLSKLDIQASEVLLKRDTAKIEKSEETRTSLRKLLESSYIDTLEFDYTLTIVLASSITPTAQRDEIGILVLLQHNFKHLRLIRSK